jgi:hypothetical protein
MFSFKKFFYSEQISHNEINEIAKLINSILGEKYRVGKILLSRNIGNNTKTVLVKQDEEEPASGFRQEVIDRNFKSIFGKTNLVHSEILKFEFPDNNNSWLVIMMGEMPNGKKAAYLSLKPDLVDYGLVSKIGNKLKEFGYLINPVAGEEHVEIDFLDKLTRIFRPASSMSFHAGMWETINSQYEELKLEHPVEYKNFEIAKRKVYGRGILAKRKMNKIKALPTLPNGEEVETSQLKSGVKIYYPLTHSKKTYFSQWSDAEDVEDTDDELERYQSLLGSGMILESFIPVERIVFGQKMFPSGSSSLVFEKELMVMHPKEIVNSKRFDPLLICTATW